VPGQDGCRDGGANPVGEEDPLSDLSIEVTPSGVRVSSDFRDNLIIDRYDTAFVTMRASKVKHLRSENSEDAVTWNVFRSLRQIDPVVWIPSLARAAFPDAQVAPERVTVSLWSSVNPPIGLLADGDEGASEIDVVFEAAHWVWFIEAKYRGDISRGTTTRPMRDQVLRNIDVGSYFAGVRQFYFSLLIATERSSPVGVETVRRYANFAQVRGALAPHRPDGLANLQGVGLLTWANLVDVLDQAVAVARRDDERGYAARAAAWLRTKALTPMASA